MTPANLWRATRAYSLPASVVPVALGTVLALRGYGLEAPAHFASGRFVLTLSGAILAHVGANVLNDYFDFVRGVDSRPEHGSGVLTRRELTPGQAFGFALALFGGAALCAVPLLRAAPGVVGPLALVGLACAVFYSAWLKQFALGDLLIVIAFGFGLTLGAFGVQTGKILRADLLRLALYSLPICLLVDAILHANNLRDAPDDRAARVATLATLLGQRWGWLWQYGLLFGPLALVVLGVATRWLPVWSLATFLALPPLMKAARTGSVEGTAQTHLIFGVLYTLSLLFSPLIR
jgi:1,4-dihydroxy-2-naphthoate polyprenyltransferase